MSSTPVSSQVRYRHFLLPWRFGLIYGFFLGASRGAKFPVHKWSLQACYTRPMKPHTCHCHRETYTHKQRKKNAISVAHMRILKRYALICLYFPVITLVNTRRLTQMSFLSNLPYLLQYTWTTSSKPIVNIKTIWRNTEPLWAVTKSQEWRSHLLTSVRREQVIGSHGSADTAQSWSWVLAKYTPDLANGHIFHFKLSFRFFFELDVRRTHAFHCKASHYVAVQWNTWIIEF